MRSGSPLIWAVLATGLAAGVALEIATFLVARYGPREAEMERHGALAMPFRLGPAVLAGGCVAIALHHRGAPTWLRVGIGAGLIGALLAFTAAAAITLGGGLASLTASQVLNLAR